MPTGVQPAHVQAVGYAQVGVAAAPHIQVALVHARVVDVDVHKPHLLLQLVKYHVVHPEVLSRRHAHKRVAQGNDVVANPAYDTMQFQHTIATDRLLAGAVDVGVAVGAGLHSLKHRHVRLPLRALCRALRHLGMRLTEVGAEEGLQASARCAGAGELVELVAAIKHAAPERRQLAVVAHVIHVDQMPWPLAVVVVDDLCRRGKGA
jgi:hypothetical protein